MKLNPSPNPTKSDFITQVISSIEDGFIPSDRTDLVEKERQVFRLVFLFLVEATGLEPAASASRTQRSTKLSHASIPEDYNTQKSTLQVLFCFLF